MGEVVSVSSKRIALAVEINEATFDAFSWLLPDSKYDLFVADSSVLIVPVIMPIRQLNGVSRLMR